MKWEVGGLPAEHLTVKTQTLEVVGGDLEPRRLERSFTVIEKHKAFVAIVLSLNLAAP